MRASTSRLTASSNSFYGAKRLSPYSTHKPSDTIESFPPYLRERTEGLTPLLFDSSCILGR
jgi:hypothetical protein